jgi:thiamine-phosphate pyrophosphorylase
MAHDPEVSPPRLYLVSPPLAAAAPFDAALKAALAAGDVACVLVRLATGDPGQRKQVVRDLAKIVQDADAALLVENDVQLAARAGADGAHVSGSGEPFEQALESLKPERIVGVGGLETRDECMGVGERDVDYLMFGGPDDPLPHAEALDRATWWAEIFNVPCVAFATSLDEIDALAAAHVEFVALGDAVWNDARGPAAAVAEAQKRCAGALA